MFEFEINEIIKNIKTEKDISKGMYLKLTQGIYDIGTDENNLLYYIEDESYINMYTNIQKTVWFKLDREVRNNLTYKFFTKEFNTLFLNNYLNPKAKVEIDIQYFNKYFQKLEKKEFSVVTKIYGLNVTPNNTSLKLGNYLLCDYAFFNESFRPMRNLVHINLDFEKIPKGDIDNCFIINEKISAINSDIAIELFYREVETFINLIIFCTARCCNENEKISCLNTFTRASYLVIDNTEETYLMGMSNKSILNPRYYLNEEFFARNNYKKLFKFLNNENLTQLEKKLLVCADWIGQSMRTNNLTQRYTFLCIALESLLSSKSSGIMDQSITSRLREFSAFLYTEDINKRYEIYKKIPDLYNKRSEISHSGQSKKLTLENYHELLDILYPIVKKVLGLSENLKTMDDLNNYILKQKNIPIPEHQAE